MLSRIILFFLLNFGALALGSYLMNNGPNSEWYLHLNKAPWTPPGWVFGFAWTVIMLLFTFYMAFLWKSADNHAFVLLLFTVQWILNVAWSPVFFRFKLVFPALVIIFLLTVAVGWLMFVFLNKLGWKSLLIVPYFLWLFLASSLNAYALIKN